MHATRRYKLIGLLYLAPALLFVLVFTLYPFIQMVVAVVQQLVADHAAEVRRARQLHPSLHRRPVLGVAGYTLKYTSVITPILMVGGYLIALLVARNSPLRRSRGRSCSSRSSSASGCRACSGTGSSARRSASINKACMDLGPDREAGPLARRRHRLLDLGDHRLGHLEGHRLRDAAVRRGDPGDPARDQRGGDGRRCELLAAGAAGDAAADPCGRSCWSR